MTAKIYAIANQKGGVAKTTTTVNLGAYLAAAGRRVLVVDGDPQGNATTSLGVDPRSLSVSLYNVLIDRVPIQEALTLTDWVGLDLIPATTDLAGAEVEMARLMARERLLERALMPLHESYDYILIDEPPSLGLLTINGLTAATHGVIIPVQCEYLALEGLSLLLQTIQQVREVLNARLTIAGVLLTMYDARTNLGQQVAEEVCQYFPDQVFNTIIPRNVRLSEAPSYGQTILSYAPNSAGALAYRALAEEFMAREEKRSPNLVGNEA
ncbi:ParA family protein [Litorilinea aerophila]|uniref:ParA family protein n=1 Tax=Litorilinea aerophila TaxID=1204385 RepID=A0A540V8W7_9CHLR|nr:ParA family protein [Litorilinea aerophila]MCC9078857.1 ParA family protein [Litorilinea aerophila]OUC05607.1 sporulation initiation inhibitor Soj [Litorilinea aerophila]GIV78748.1 MAG: sporulation initiation inhibitor Soj [Litorilinea sp.]